MLDFLIWLNSPLKYAWLSWHGWLMICNVISTTFSLLNTSNYQHKRLSIVCPYFMNREGAWKFLNELPLFITIDSIDKRNAHPFNDDTPLDFMLSDRSEQRTALLPNKNILCLATKNSIDWYSVNISIKSTKIKLIQIVALIDLEPMFLIFFVRRFFVWHENNRFLICFRGRALHSLLTYSR